MRKTRTCGEGDLPEDEKPRAGRYLLRKQTSFPSGHPFAMIEAETTAPAGKEGANIDVRGATEQCSEVDAFALRLSVTAR